MASNVMLKISSLLELVHMNNGGEPSEYVMKSLPDAMFCHKLGHFIDGEKIQNYLFDRILNVQ